MSSFFSEIFCFIGGIIVGGIGCYLLWKERLNKGRDYTELKEKYIELETLRRTEGACYREKYSEWEQIEKKFNDTFKSISLELFQQNARSFLGLAEESLKKHEIHSKLNLETQQSLLEKSIGPLKENLNVFQQKIQKKEKTRTVNETALKKQIENLNGLQLRLETKTNELSRSLRDPNVKGRWGELQLKRAVEYAGMVEYVDFETQKSFETETGTLRPDMVVRLPNERTIVIDAKSPLFEELFELDHTEFEQSKRLKSCCQRVRDTIGKLGAKAYAAELPNSPDFVLLFFPGEWLLSIVLKEDPALIEHASKNNVLLATPTTLIALLKAIAYGWKQVDMAKEAKEICRLGGEVYERLSVFFNYFQDLRKHLGKVTDTYNQMVGSIETRIFPAAERLQTFSKKNTNLALPETLHDNLRSSSKWNTSN